MWGLRIFFLRNRSLGAFSDDNTEPEPEAEPEPELEPEPEPYKITTFQTIELRNTSKIHIIAKLFPFSVVKWSTILYYYTSLDTYKSFDL